LAVFGRLEAITCYIKFGSVWPSRNNYMLYTIWQDLAVSNHLHVVYILAVSGRLETITCYIKSGSVW